MRNYFKHTIHFTVSTLAIEHPLERTIIRTLCISLATLAATYVYFVSASVLNVIARKDAARNTTSITTSIALLEQQYFNQSDSVSRDALGKLGLVPIGQASYVYRDGNVGMRSTNAKLQSDL